MIWQLIVVKLAQQNCSDFKSPLKRGKDELCDLIIGQDAIDTKYRIGSGDSGTLKKFKEYGESLKKEKMTPILLILREDNLNSAITACKSGGWKILSGKKAFQYLLEKTNVDVFKLLRKFKGRYILK